MNEDPAEPVIPEVPRRRLQPARFNSIDPAIRHLAPYLLLALAVVALFPPGVWGEATADFSRLIGVIVLAAGLGVLAYRRWGRS